MALDNLSLDSEVHLSAPMRAAEVGGAVRCPEATWAASQLHAYNGPATCKRGSRLRGGLQEASNRTWRGKQESVWETLTVSHERPSIRLGSEYGPLWKAWAPGGKLRCGSGPGEKERTQLTESSGSQEQSMSGRNDAQEPEIPGSAI